MNCCERHGLITCNQGRNCPARCDAMGVCQDLTPRCQGCEPPSPATEVYSLITYVLYALFAVVLSAGIGLSLGVLWAGV